MKFSEAEATIRKFFNTGWGSTTKISWPDMPFDPPDRQTWVRFNCAETLAQQASMGDIGNNRFRHYGIITIQIFQPQGKAGLDAASKADLALGIFMGKEVDGINFYNVSARQIGDDGNGYYQINVVAWFRYDQIT